MRQSWDEDSFFLCGMKKFITFLASILKLPHQIIFLGVPKKYMFKIFFRTQKLYLENNIFSSTMKIQSGRGWSEKKVENACLKCV